MKKTKTTKSNNLAISIKTNDSVVNVCDYFRKNNSPIFARVGNEIKQVSNKVRYEFNNAGDYGTHYPSAFLILKDGTKMDVTDKDIFVDKNGILYIKD